jgi:hypothetical protein
MYKKGYSLFFIGKDEISYISLKDSVLISNFEKLSPFADPNTRLVIGSCYGGATYNRSSIDYKDTTRIWVSGTNMMPGSGQSARVTRYPSTVMAILSYGVFHMNMSGPLKKVIIKN